MTDVYTKDGVNVPLGDTFSAYAASKSRETWGNSPFVEVTDLSNGSFRGPRGVRFKDLPEGCFQAKAADGIGTKVNLITAARMHHKAGRDILAMTGGDITRWGGLPLLFHNVLDVCTLGTSEESGAFKSFKRLIDGLAGAATEQGIVLVTGETAELGCCVGSEDLFAETKFNWAGFAEGVYHPDRMITGQGLAPGQVVVALMENGFRSNGISTVRAALRLKFGDAWWQNPAAFDAIHRAARPSVLYERLLTAANGWWKEYDRIPMTCIVHITGGGIPGKFGTDILFPAGLSATLDELWKPPLSMKDCVEWRRLDKDTPFPDKKIYTTFNGGQGALVVLESEFVDPFLVLAQHFGIHAQPCGRIHEPYVHPKLVIHSKFSNEVLTYSP